MMQITIADKTSDFFPTIFTFIHLFEKEKKRNDFGKLNEDPLKVEAIKSF